MKQSTERKFKPVLGAVDEQMNDRYPKFRKVTTVMQRTPISKEFCQSLLCVEVPLVVTLARTSMAVENVLKLVPGVMITFDKACDSPLTVEVGDQRIAEGEVVKVGDKFGLRVSSILPPEERFVPLRTTPPRS